MGNCWHGWCWFQITDTRGQGPRALSTRPATCASPQKCFSDRDDRDAAPIPDATGTPAGSPRRTTCLVPAAVHDLVDGVRCQLGPVEPVALGDLHHHLRVVIQVVGLLAQAEYLPHQDPCTAPRGSRQTKRQESQGQKGIWLQKYSSRCTKLCVHDCTETSIVL